MMRYQRVSPDCLPLSNGRKPTLRTCKEDDPDNNNVKIPNNFSTLEGKPLRIRSGSGSANPSPSQDHHFPHFSVSPDPVHSENQTAATPSAPTGKSPNHHEINNGSSPGGGAGGDVILQWGHNKRSRGSRAENRVVGDESSVHPRQVIKLQRRSTVGSEKQAILAAATAMPPPCASSYSRGANLRPCMPSREATASLLNRSVEERSGGLSRSEKRSPPSPPEKAHNKMASTCSLPNGFSSAQTAADPSMNQESTRRPPSDQETGGSGSGSGFAAAATTTTEKLNLDQFEWPRIYVSLSRKEKEDDFLAMKGTKLPQRPKRRAKNIDKTLQYCFPGMWLSDLTRGRYEVREKKCVKKKRRGLKGMESSDSE